MIRTILDTSVKYLPGVGEKRAVLLGSQCNIYTYKDLLYYFPYKHLDRTRFYRTTEVREEMPYIQLRGRMGTFRTEGEKRKKRLIATFSDRWGVVQLVWFNSISRIQEIYKPGQEYIVFGKPARFGSTYTIVHPEVDKADDPKARHGGTFYPIYSTTEKLRKAGLTSRTLCDLVANCLDIVMGKMQETLPDYLIQKYHMLPLEDALRSMHLPANAEMLRRATLRLKFEELFYVRLRMRYLHGLRQTNTPGYPLTRVGDSFMSFFNNVLPFELTAAQKRVVSEIHHDVKSGRQMNRLLQGDVGSGKTIVALLAMLLAVDNGCQAALMAPTEILAHQHYETLSVLVKPLGLQIELLTGSTRMREKNRIVTELESGKVSIVVGTHALLENYVAFHKLGLAVIDEQHRFGVSQRSVLWEKGGECPPHILVMSATPIPRTLAMTLYGDLDVSVIDELPPGRTPIETRHCYEENFAPVHFFMLEQLQQGHQIYVVYPLIEESEKLDLQSLQEGFARMKECFPAHRVGMVHGRMSAQEKEEQMAAFSSRDTHILVATTVIEVGVNVPNASVMVIQNAERFGLSQLHQLRGRVGRGAARSYCILMTPQKISADTRRRIEVMVATTNGFEIAEEDMKLRGHGDLEGTRQSGIGVDFKVANLTKDGRVVQFCTKLVDEILGADPLLQHPANAVLLREIRESLEHEKDWGVIS